MTHRSRNGGPPKTHRKKNQTGPKRKLHHPPSQPTSQPDLSDSPSDNSEFPPLPIKQFDNPTESDLLVVVHRALRQTLDNPTFSSSVQTVKALLYNRKWLEVFTNPVLLEVYVGRWVPSRGVCYRELMIRLGAIRGLFRPSLPSRHDEEEEIDDRLMKSRSEDEGTDNEGEKEEDEVVRLQKGIKDGSGGNKEEIIDIISLGGGAGSELLAISSLIASITTHSHSSSHSIDNTQSLSSTSNSLPLATQKTQNSPSEQGLQDRPTGPKYRWTAVDIGPWGPILGKLFESIQREWDIPLVMEYIEGDLLSSTDLKPDKDLSSEHSSPRSIKQSPSTSQGDIHNPHPIVTELSSASNSINTSSLISPHQPSQEDPRPSDLDDKSSIGSDNNRDKYHLPTLLRQKRPKLITLLFTLSELLAQSRSQTIRLLRDLSDVPPGTLLLVVDSASDISDVSLGEEGRKWPSWMVLDAVMLGPSKETDQRRQNTTEGHNGRRDVGQPERGEGNQKDGGEELEQETRGTKSQEKVEGAVEEEEGLGITNGAGKEKRSKREQGEWTLVRSEDSRWYRLSEGLGSGWPTKLENTRYWYRLYRRS